MTAYIDPDNEKQADLIVARLKKPKPVFHSGLKIMKSRPFDVPAGSMIEFLHYSNYDLTYSDTVFSIIRNETDK